MKIFKENGFGFGKIILKHAILALALSLFMQPTIASCNGCDCGNGEFPTGHCCTSNGDCVSGDSCEYDPSYNESGNSCVSNCNGCNCGDGLFTMGHCCESDGDCDSNLTCSAGLCELKPCTSGSECGSGVCTAGLCQNSLPACSSTINAGSGALCQSVYSNGTIVEVTPGEQVNSPDMGFTYSQPQVSYQGYCAGSPPVQCSISGAPNNVTGCECECAAGSTAQWQNCSYSG